MHHDLPSKVYHLLSEKDNVVLLETSRYDRENFTSYLFIDPVEVLQIQSVDEVPRLFSTIERCVANGYYVAGYLAYECGYAFEEIADLPPSREPLAFFGVYRPSCVFNHLTGRFENLGNDLLASALDEPSLKYDYHVSHPILNITLRDYTQKINRIKEYILSGDTYQINFTTKYRFDFQGSALGAYIDLKKKQRVSCGAYMRSKDREILCLSPELFFRYKDGTIVTKPMKGTAQRGKTLEEDLQQASWLRHDEKNRAENLMIVDLLRNDLGRISEIGTVNVQELFSVEKYQTLFQMTSTISGRVKTGTTYLEILRSLFPSGSVTGAPKIRSMRIIHELEESPRGVYTGAIGYFSPANEAVFNVAIRTIVIRGNTGEMGVGSGIVFDSVPEDEYSECELKGQFLTVPYGEFELLETMLWDNGYPFLDRHLKRLNESAQYFDYVCDVENLRERLLDLSRSFTHGKKYKVRVRVDFSGRASIEYSIIHEDGLPSPGRVALSSTGTDSRNRFLHHKTTNRRWYDEAYEKAVEKGYVDVLFMNEEGQITECTRHNIVIKKGASLFTPPIECGLLNGIYRQHLLETRAALREKVLYEQEIREAETIYICNAVRGMKEVILDCSSVDLA